MKRRQYVAGATAALAGLPGCLDIGHNPDEIEPYDFAVENRGNETLVEVRMRRDDESVYETELDMEPGETWEFEGEPRGSGTITVIVVANGYSGVRDWSNPDGAGFLEAAVYDDGVEFARGVP